MKNSTKSVIKRTFTLLGIVFIMSIGFVTTMSAQGKSLKLARRPDVVAPKTLEVVVFQVDNTLKFKVHLENHSNDEVTIKIKNAENKILYEDKAGNVNKYIRKFDFSTMADGEYTFEVTNRNETYTKAINLQTLSARTLQINE